nr:Proline--tRNA ligase [Candidatus Pantoea persica]
MPVRFSPQAEQQRAVPHLERFIREVLAPDPSPAYRKGEAQTRDYAVWLLDFNMRWRVDETGTEVIALDPCENALLSP